MIVSECNMCRGDVCPECRLASCDCDNQWESLLNIRCQQLREANAIVDKLPTCWRLDESGKLVEDVPVVPQMITWCSDLRPFSHQWDLRLRSGETFDAHCARGKERHCDTRDAAQAARKET